MVTRGPAAPLTPVAVIVALGLCICAAWYLFILLAGTISWYVGVEVAFFRGARFRETLQIMDFGGLYQRFSPLGFGPIGYFDIKVLAPLLGLADAPQDQLAAARRMVWLHPLFAAANAGVIGFVAWRLFGDVRIVAAAMLLAGLSDTVPFQMRFVSTLVCYMLQSAAALTILALVSLHRSRGPAAAAAVVLGLVVALGVWEQGMNLGAALAVLLGLFIVIGLRARETFARIAPLAMALLAVLAVLVAYVLFRGQSGASEALTRNREASYFIMYGRLLPMLDDIVLNFSALSLQSFRQFLPFPPLSFTEMAGINMQELNQYNASYAKFPNSHYRMMGLFYAGVAFVGSLSLVAFCIARARRNHDGLGSLYLIGVVVFILGFLTHMPIMHRDSFYMTGFSMGYKTVVSYAGFILLMSLLLREALMSAWFNALPQGRKAALGGAVCAYFLLAALSRAALGEIPAPFMRTL